jgi:hypothetical protein
MKNGVKVSLFALPILALAMLPCAVAQETTAGLQGTVKDPSGGAIAKAAVEVASPALIGVKKADSDAVGAFRFVNLPPGKYTVTVTAPGFHTFKDSNVELSVGHVPELSVVMQVGAVTSRPRPRSSTRRKARFRPTFPRRI